jgi:hypothetical protein
MNPRTCSVISREDSFEGSLCEGIDFVEDHRGGGTDHSPHNGARSHGPVLARLSLTHAMHWCKHTSACDTAPAPISCRELPIVAATAAAHNIIRLRTLFPCTLSLQPPCQNGCPPEPSQEMHARLASIILWTYQATDCWCRRQVCQPLGHPTDPCQMFHFGGRLFEDDSSEEEELQRQR